MMKTALTYLFIGLSVLVGVLLVFGLVLVLDWPWWVGFFILLFIGGLAAGAFVLRRILVKRREDRFVSQIVEQDEAARRTLKDDERRQADELRERFTMAVAALKGSHLKKLGNPLYVLPWYMVIGESASGKTTAIRSAGLSSPFAEMTRVPGMSGTRNCDWWFFEQAVIIDTAGRYAIPVDEGRDKDEWQRFLNLLARYRRREPLSGLVVTVAADRLLQEPPGTMEEDGRQIRRRIDELMRVLGSTFPVYVLVTKCDLVQGMTQFCGQLDDELLRQAFGAVNHDLKQDCPGFIAAAMHAMQERLRTLRLLIFHKLEAKALDPALLLFPEEFTRLRPGIDAFTRGAFQANPYQETPMLRGLYFSSGRQEGSPYSHFLRALGLIEDREVLPGTSRGLFLHDFFAAILPRDRGLFAPTKSALAWERLTLNLGLLAWLAVGIAVCGLLSFSFVKNLGIIRGVPQEFTRQVTLQGEAAPDLQTMHRFAEAVLTVEEHNGSWWIPRLGLGQSRDVERRLKGNFSRLFDERFLALHDRRLAADIRGMDAADPAIGRTIAALITRINLIKSCLDGKGAGAPAANNAVVPAAIGQDAGRDDGTFGALYGHRLTWTDGEVLRKEVASLETLLAEAIAKTSSLRWVADWANTNAPDRAVTLGEFWGGSGGTAGEVRVEPAFTLHGKAIIDAFLLDLESAVADPSSLASRKAEFLGWYRDAYSQAWYAFGAGFPRGMETLQGAQEWKTAAARATSPKGLHFLLLARMADELEPFRDDRQPAWMKLVFQFDRDLDLAQGLQTGTIARATEKASRIKEKIQETIGREKTEELAGLDFGAARALADYEAALARIAGEVGKSRGSAFQAAAAAFGEDPSASSFAAAQAALGRYGASSGLVADALFALVSGPFNFLWAHACQESACHLQGAWEKDVLADVQGITDPAQLNQILFAPEGLATKFIRGPAAPFLGRDLTRGYYAREVFGRSLPFEPSFLRFFSQAKVGLAAAAMTAASDNTVTITGLPTEANQDARVHPHATRLTLQCMDAQQVFANMNYPVTKALTWSSQRCGGVVFSIEVGNVVLTRSYTGPDAFAKFLMEFPGGSRTFSPGDFPKEASILKNMGIRYIKVNYRFSGHQAVIGQAKPAMSQPTAVPQTILRCTGR